MKKGISLVILVITIIVLVILAGVIVFNTSDTIVNAEKMRLQSDIVQLEALMSTYKIRNNGHIGFDVAEINTSNMSSVELGQFAGESIVNNKISLYIINLAEIDAEAVNYGNLKYGTKDRYLYSLNTGKVYYELGIESDNVTYHRVENEEK